MYLRRFVLCLVLAAGLAAVNAQQAPGTVHAVEASAWGPYTRLAGHAWQLSEQYRVDWQWLTPGQELRELWTNPKNGKVVQTNVIRLGDASGRLVLNSSMMSLTWQGRIGPAGDVVWAREGMIKLPYRLRFDEQGQAKYEGVKLKDDQVTEVKYGYVLQPLGAEGEASQVVAEAVVPAPAPSPVASPAPVPQTAAADGQRSAAVDVPAPAPVAAANPAPAPAMAAPVAPANAVTGMGPLKRFAGQTFTWCKPSQVGGSNCFISFIETAEGFQICFAAPNAGCDFVFVVKSAPDRPGGLELTSVTSREGQYYVSTGAEWVNGGKVLELSTRKKYYESLLTEAIKLVSAPHGGWVNKEAFWLADDGKLMRRAYGWKVRLLGGKADEYDISHELVPVTPEMLAQYGEIQRLWAIQNEQDRALAAQRRREEEAQREANFSAFMGGLNTVAQSVQQDMEQVNRANQAVADARLAMEQAQAREQARQQAELRAQQQAKQQAQVAMLSQQQANAQVAEQSRQQEAQQAEQARLAQQQAADQARKQQQAEADRAAKEAERKRQEEQRKLAAEQARRQVEQNLRASFRGRAETCVGGGKDIYYLQTSTPPKTGCNVSFEARCPGTASGAGVQFSQYNYVGGSCQGLGDNIRIGPMSCPAEQVQISMTSATCG